MDGMKVDEDIRVRISPQVWSPPSTSKLFKQLLKLLTSVSCLSRSSKPSTNPPPLLHLTMSLQHFPMIAQSNKNGSLPVQPISDAQVSILDIFLFPGFTRAVQVYLAMELSVYVPLLYLLGLFVLACRRICKYLLTWFETYCSKSPLYSNNETPRSDNQ